MTTLEIVEGRTILCATQPEGPHSKDDDAVDAYRRALSW